ncbi:MAG: transcriptional repressor [Deltaproteobacteria bacterium]|nr:transcriptional repressor [Deltaproteobacteria bacterium]
MAQEKCNPNEILAKKGIRATGKRILILEELIKDGALINANRLHKKLSRFASIDLVTIYRVLNLFRDHGVLRSVKEENRSELFELACQHHQLHPHFCCKECDETICLEPLNFDALKSLFPMAEGYEVDNLKVTFSGTCPTCRKNR